VCGGLSWYRKSSSLMKGAFLLWLPLLEPLDAPAPGFAEQLIDSMLEILKTTSMDYALDELKCSSAVPFLASSPPVPEDKEFNKALTAWIKQLTGTSPAHRFGRTTPTESGGATLDVDSLAKQCIFSPNEWYAPRTQTQIMTTDLFPRTLDILTHILKCHPALNSKYSVLASIARTQASFVIETADKDTAGKATKKSKTNRTTRAIQDIEDELSQFEEKLGSIDSQMEEWMQGRCQLREGQNQNGRKQDMAIDGQKAGNDESGKQSYHKWARYPGVWTPRPIGVL